MHGVVHVGWMVSERYVRLMNGPYDRILETAGASWIGPGGPELTCSYDGEEWVAAVTVRPSQARNRWISASGETLERALNALETELGLPRSR